MSEVTVHFKNARNGYDKQEVDQFLKEEIEVRFRQKSDEIVGLQKRVSELETELQKLTGGDTSIEEKVELYEKLMKKMDGDYEKLLAPAIAKAKAIEDRADREYRIRMDQAKYTAEGIYAETADRIKAVLDQNLNRIYGMVDDYIRSKTLRAKLLRFCRACGTVAQKTVAAIVVGQKSAEHMAKKAEAKAEKLIGKAERLRANAKQLREQNREKRRKSNKQ